MRAGLRAALVALVLGLASPASLARVDALGPRLSVEPAGFDFGRVLQHKTLRTQFRLRNFGDGEWRLSALHSDCDCAVALLDNGSRRLAPGESASLEVRLETRRSLGRIVRHVRLDSNDSTRPTLELWLAAEVRTRR